MRIAYLSASTIPSRSANSIHVMKMCQAFTVAGQDTTLFAAQGNLAQNNTPHEIATDFTYYGIEREFPIVKSVQSQTRWVGKGRYVYSTLQKLKAAPRPDLLYARCIPSLLAASQLGIPMILEVHDTIEHPLVKRMLRWLFRRPHFLGIVAISAALANEYQRTYPALAAHRFLVAHDCADLPPKNLDAQTVKLPQRDAALQVGYTGHLYPRNGIEIILALAANTPTADFHIVGGEQRDREKWQAARASDNIHFHGHVPHRTVAAYLDQLDVVLAPYQPAATGEGKRNTTRWMSPLKIFEYMAAGKAIIASDLPVLREVFTHAENALLVESDDLAAWIEAVNTLQNDSKLRARLGQTAHQHFLAHYTWQKRAEAVIHFANTLRRP